jgi:hypothetical protein
VTPRPISPPPCAQACWEYITVPGQARPAWTYIASAGACGHTYDTDARIWRWPNRPTTTQETQP